LSSIQANNEKELLLQVSQGDQQAFARLFNIHHPQLATYIFHLTASAELTEEIVQEVFLKVWANHISLAQVDDFRAWLFTISKNYALNCLRKMVNERLRHKEWLKLQYNETAVVDPTYEEQYQLMVKAIDHLPPQQKKVFVLSRINKLKYEEIAAQLNLSRETVKSYIKLAGNSISKFVSSHSQLFIAISIITALLKIVC
jgi:RNA polymerase sigma-70 factor (family 1)